jgi:hypothetical protein
MTPQCGVESVDLFPDRQVPDSSQQVLQRHETAPQARFLGAHPNPEVALQVPRAVQREPQKVDRLWALPAVFGGMSVREPAKFDEPPPGFYTLARAARLSGTQDGRASIKFRLLSQLVKA